MKRILLITILLATLVTVSAQKLSVNAPRHIAIGEQFQIEYTIQTQNVKGFRLENIPNDIEILYGPNTSSQSSYRIVNGHMSSSSSITYSFIAVAKKKGNHALPVARVNIDGKTVSSAAHHINVLGASHSSSNSYANSGGYYPEDEDASSYHRSQNSRNTHDNIFIQVTASKKRVHEQEPILLTYKVYAIPNLVNLDYKMPELKGFHTQEIPLSKTKSMQRETLNGQVYNCVVWSQFVLYPQVTGKLTIPSLTFHGVIMHESRDPFAFITGGGYEEEAREIKAPGLTIQVDKLPTKPKDFSGGVGRFNISGQLNKKEVKAGDPVSLRLVVSGVGNLKLIKQPEVTFPKNWDKYDAKITDKTRLTKSGVEGNMIYDILAVPRKEGAYTVPPVKFVYYDTSTSSYKTIQTQPLSVKVLRGTGGDTDVSDFSPMGGGEDIRSIKKGDVTFYDPNDIFFNSVWYWITLGVLSSIFVSLLYFFRRTALEHADIAKMRGKKANKLALKHLKKADTLIREGKSSDFYDEVSHALWGYVGNRLNMPIGQLTRDDVCAQLKKRNVDEETIMIFLDALDECEFERYAPGDTKGNMNKTFNSAMSAITRIEGFLKNARKSSSTSKALVLLILLMFSLPICAITKKNADTEYEKRNYQQAIKDYEELLQNGVSYEVYYNLGNAYYRLDNIPRAILSYERALRLSPNDEDVRVNLKMAQSKTIDKIIPEPKIFLYEWYKGFVNMMNIEGWAYTAIICIIFMIILVLLYLFAENSRLRLLGFWGGILALLFFIFSNIFAFQQLDYLHDKTDAIVISSSVIVKDSPYKGAKDKFVLHEGTKVEILDTANSWVNVHIADGRNGWIEVAKIENI